MIGDPNGVWEGVPELLGGPVEVVDWLRDEGRNRAARLRTVDGDTVVAKRAMGDDSHPFRIGDSGPESAFVRFCNDAAGCAMLGALAYGPRRLAVDPQRGVFVMEDLGAGTSLADVLTGDGPADAAVAALEAYVRTLARMHRESRGQKAAWDASRWELGAERQEAPPQDRFDPSVAGRFRARCAAHDIPVAETVGAELDAIAADLAAPGDWLSFTPSDCCPDNHFLRGDTVAFFDCEFATYRHALLDLAYVVAPFPTCWCAARLPDGIPARLVALYRSENDGPDFDRQMARCAAFWTVTTLTWTWAGDPSIEDSRWGISTLRQRDRLRVENFLSVADRADLPGLTRTLAALGPKLPAPEAPMALYPVFRA